MSQENFVEIPISFSRQGSFPLDRYSRFDNMTDAVDYVENNGACYNGQIISILDRETEKYIAYIVNNGQLEKISDPAVTIVRYV